MYNPSDLSLCQPGVVLCGSRKFCFSADLETKRQLNSTSEDGSGEGCHSDVSSVLITLPSTSLTSDRRHFEVVLFYGGARG